MTVRPPCRGLFLVVWTLLAAVSFAQQAGGIRGVLYDDDFDAPLPVARVTIAETGEEVTSTDEGNYVFNQLPPGTYTLVFSKDGYTRQVKADVVVSPGRLTEVNASLSGDFVEMEEFVVQEIQFAGGTEAALLELRFESPALMDSISAELMSKAGASDAAAALTLVSGTTVQDGKFAVIRGLPDRYVNSQMNGVRLPTADPEKRAVQLDQFPAAAIESIQVSKTFTPDQQGDASGGAVNIVLKGIPDERVIQAGVSTSYNEQFSYEDDFLTSNGGGFDDYWGFREFDEQLTGQSWDGAVGTTRDRAPIDYKWNMALGDRLELDDGVTVGGFGSFFYERDSSYFENGTNDKLWVAKKGEGLTPRTSQGSPSQDEFLTSLFDVTEGSQQIRWGMLGAVGIETENHSITASGLLTHDAEDTASLLEDTRGKEYYFPGHDPDDQSTPGHGEDSRDAAPYLRLQTLLFRERETRTLQLHGAHTLPDPEMEISGFLNTLSPEVDWTVSRSYSELKEPDKRQFGSQWKPGIDEFNLPPTYTAFKPSANFTLGNLQRVDKEVKEESDQYSVNVKLPFEQWTDSEGFLKFGIFKDEVDRRYDQDSFSNFSDPNDGYVGDWEDYWSDVWEEQEHLITAAKIDVNYTGEQEIGAWYWMADIPLTSWFNVIGGYRYEDTEISIINDPEENATWFRPGETSPSELGPGDADVFFEQSDTLPSLGFRFHPIDLITLRGSYSETVARQTFRELSPILQQEFLGSDIFIGNPELQMSAVKNYDLRLDLTPTDDTLISVSYFLKEIEDPIENVQRVANNFDYTTPINYPEGELSGWELEIRQEMGRIWGGLEGLMIGGNATFIDSEVTLPEEEAAQFSDPDVDKPIETRDMTNAPEHLYNIYMTYKMDKIGLRGTELAVFYTVRGDTLVAGAGTDFSRFVPSVYETEFETLNASLTQKITDYLKVKLQVKNILDPEIQTVYRSEHLDGDTVKTSYKKGREYSLGLTASF